MKLLLKRMLFLLIVAGSFHLLQGQAYKHGLGLRLGPTYGVSYKTFVSEKLAFEAMMNSRYYGRDYGYYSGNGRKVGYWGKNSGPGANFVALLEYHIPLADIKGLNLYFGAGLHLGVWEGYKDHPYYPEERNYVTFGIDFILGVEYQFAEIPLILALDYKPAYDFVGAYRAWPDELAFSIRIPLDKI